MADKKKKMDESGTDTGRLIERLTTATDLLSTSIEIAAMSYVALLEVPPGITAILGEGMPIHIEIRQKTEAEQKAEAGKRPKASH